MLAPRATSRRPSSCTAADVSCVFVCVCVSRPSVPPSAAPFSVYQTATMLPVPPNDPLVVRDSWL